MVKSINSRLLVGILALTLVCGLFVSVKAWNNKPVPTLTEQWFAYNGATQDRDDVKNPQNYTLLNDEPSCATGKQLCSIHAPINTFEEPVLEPQLVDQIMDAIENQTSTTAIKLKN